MLRHPTRSTGNTDAALRNRREAPLRAPHVTDREDRIRRIAGSSGTARSRRAASPARTLLAERIEHHLGRLRETAAPLRAGSMDDDVARCDPPTQGFAMPSIASAADSPTSSRPPRESHSP